MLGGGGAKEEDREETRRKEKERNALGCEIAHHGLDPTNTGRK
jgi:hypothetical protein